MLKDKGPFDTSVTTRFCFVNFL